MFQRNQNIGNVLLETCSMFSQSCTIFVQITACTIFVQITACTILADGKVETAPWWCSCSCLESSILLWLPQWSAQENEAQSCICYSCTWPCRFHMCEVRHILFKGPPSSIWWTESTSGKTPDIRTCLLESVYSAWSLQKVWVPTESGEKWL